MSSYFVSTPEGLKHALGEEYIHMKNPMPEEFSDLYDLIKTTNTPTKYYYRRKSLESLFAAPPSPAKPEPSQAELKEPESELTTAMAELEILGDDEKYRRDVKEAGKHLKTALFMSEPSEGPLKTLKDLLFKDSRKDLLDPAKDPVLFDVTPKDFEPPELHRDIVHISLANAFAESSLKALEIARGFVIPNEELQPSGANKQGANKHEGTKPGETAEARLGEPSRDLWPVKTPTKFVTPPLIDFDEKFLKSMSFEDFNVVGYPLIVDFIKQVPSLDGLTARARGFREFINMHGGATLLTLLKLAHRDNYLLLKDLYEMFPVKYAEGFIGNQTDLTEYWHHLEESTGFPSQMSKIFEGSNKRMISHKTAIKRMTHMVKLLTWPLAGTRKSKTFKTDEQALEYLFKHAHKGIKGYWKDGEVLPFDHECHHSSEEEESSAQLEDKIESEDSAQAPLNTNEEESSLKEDEEPASLGLEPEVSLSPEFEEEPATAPLNTPASAPLEEPLEEPTIAPLVTEAVPNTLVPLETAESRLDVEEEPQVGSEFLKEWSSENLGVLKM